MPTKEQSTEHVLVLGSTSYIGTAFVDQLRQAGLRTTCWGSKECDLTDVVNVRVKAEQCHDEKFSSVVCFAAVNKYVENNYQSLLKNIAIANSVSEFRQLAAIPYLLFISSADVYGSSPRLPLTEDSATRPDSFYGLAKVASEWIVCNSKNTGQETLVVRIPGVFGPASNERSVVGALIKTAKSGGVIRLTGRGAQRRDYLYVQDAAKALAALMKTRATGVLNLATGTSRSLLDYAVAIKESLAPNVEIDCEQGEGSRDFDLIFDTRLLRESLKDFAFTPLEKALRSYAN